MEEIWKDIPGFENAYQVSTFGRVRSLDRQIKSINGRTRIAKGKLLIPTHDGRGYLQVGLGRKIKRRIHVLVAVTFLNRDNSNQVVNHKDMNKSNNNVDNLEYVTLSQNTRHAVQNGKHNKAKITKEQIELMKKMRLEGRTYSQLGKHFNMSKSTAFSIINGLSWGWL